MIPYKFSKTTPHQKKHFESSDMIVRISCWNVKSLRNPTKFSLKLINTIETMKQKNSSLLALSETQWVGKGIVELEDTTVIFLGIDEKRW